MEERLKNAHRDSCSPKRNPQKTSANLWSDLGRDAEVSGGVLRACGMTLVVAAEDDSDMDSLRHTLGVLMHNHPARAIVLRFRDQPGLDASVFSQCWMPFGKHQQICAEGIEITAGRMELFHVAQLLLPLIVSDLPAVLWCRGPRVFLWRWVRSSSSIGAEDHCR